jgi:diguanylate cyclase (GGDEF)-like protein/PAS domain S-box-containing protein
MNDVLRKTGTIWGVVIWTAVWMGWIMYKYLVRGGMEWTEGMVLLVVISGLFSWWIGWQYDRVKYFAEKYRLQSLELQRSNMKFQTIFTNAGMGIALIDRSGRLMEVNPKFIEMFGYNEQELQGMRIADFSCPDDTPKNMRLLQELMEGKIDNYQLDKRYIRKDGQMIWGKVISTLLPGERDSCVLGIVTPITEHKSTEEKLLEQNQVLETLSNSDALTGVGNRRYFEEGLQQKWEQAMAQSRPIALLMLDVDFFKEFNDRYGHHAGDDCLRRVADTMKQVVGLKGGVNRYGGEEFAILLPSVNEDETRLIGEQLRSAVESLGIPHERSAAGSCVTISIGAASIIPSKHMRPEELILRADKSLYQAKKEGRNRVLVS